MNPSSIIVAVLVSAVFVCAVAKLVIDKRRGRGGCSGGCTGCPYSDDCNKKTPK